MKLLSMFSEKESLRQMSLSDQEQLLDNMCKDSNFEYFDKVFIIYNYEDGYAPANSSKIVANNKDILSSRMAFNFWSNVKVTYTL